MDPRRRRGHRARHRGPDDRGHRLRSRSRGRHHACGDAYQEGDFSPEDDAGDHDLRSRADCRPAAPSDRGHRHGRARALPRSLLRARLPPDGRRHRCRRHPPREGKPGARRRRRSRHRGARTHDVGGRDGRHRLPEGARRHSRALPSGGRDLQYASRHDERRVHALRPCIQRQGHRGPNGAALDVARTRRRLARPA